ncbi:MAG: efflux RND transporter periplasmic adaptor subunit [Bacteroidales bacterium]|nr:efflux RND transporter periplasmic adaptor subunit [Bacteroidales bacterium]
MKRILVIILSAALLQGCNNSQGVSDAYGNFEADKTLISAEVTGRILQFNLEEGDLLSAGQIVGQIDSLDLHLKKEQMEAQILALKANFDQINAQLEVQQQQLENIEISRLRTENLKKEGAATQKQMDDVQGQYELAKKQLIAINSQGNALTQQINALREQKKQIELNLQKSTLSNPVDGSVLNKYAMTGEMAMAGRALYAIADLSSLKLKAYISGQQLSQIKLGQQVKVLIDAPGGKLESLSGSIVWISETAEFTPKTIQTREDRINLVYAFKVKVPNDGRLKIGMPGEVVFKTGEHN